MAKEEGGPTIIISKERPKQSWFLPETEILKRLSQQAILLRHAPTPLNEMKLLQGSTDVDLSEKGRVLAREMRDELLNKQVMPTIIYSSPMKRTQQTAEIIAQITGLPITSVTGLREYEFGEFEGKQISELKKDPVHETWLKNPAKYQQEFGRPIEAEFFFPFIQRVGNSLTSMFENQTNTSDRVLIVTHATVIRAISFILRLNQIYQSPINITNVLEQSPFFFYDERGQFMQLPHGLISL